MHDRVWLGLGILAQLLFFARFIVQWLTSERRGESVIPPAFWYFSLGGGVLLLAYSIAKRDPVFILGQSLGQYRQLTRRRLIALFRSYALYQRRSLRPQALMGQQIGLNDR